MEGQYEEVMESRAVITVKLGELDAEFEWEEVREDTGVITDPVEDGVTGLDGTFVVVPKEEEVEEGVGEAG